MYRIISSPTEPTPTYVADTEEDLPLIWKEQSDSNMIGVAVLVLATTDIWMIDGNKEWRKL